MTKWRVEFYNERRGILARYDIEASSPEMAIRAGRHAALAEHPSPPAHWRRWMLGESRMPAGSYRHLWRGRLDVITREDSPPLVVELHSPLRHGRSPSRGCLRVFRRVGACAADRPRPAHPRPRIDV